MSLPTASAVRALAGVLDHLKGTDQDAALDALISDADEILATWCGYPPASAGAVPTLEATTYTHYLDGPNCRESRRLDLTVRPVSSVTSVHDDTDNTWDYGAADLVDSADYTLDGVEGAIYLNPQAAHGSWRSGLRRIKVVYVAGWDTGATGTLTRAIGLLVDHFYRLSPAGNKTGATATGRAESFRGLDLPPHVKQLMWPYLLPEVGMS